MKNDSCWYTDRSDLTVPSGTGKKKPYRLQLWNMKVVFYNFWTDQRSDIEIDRFFLFSKEFFIFEFSSRRRRSSYRLTPLNTMNDIVIRMLPNKYAMIFILSWIHCCSDTLMGILIFLYQSVGVRWHKQWLTPISSTYHYFGMKSRNIFASYTTSQRLNRI